MPRDERPEAELREIEIQPSTIETVDFAMTEWVQSLNVHAQTNKGFKPVPVLWVAAERSYSVKNNKDLRDSSGAVILPLLTVERTSMTKDLSRKGAAFGNLPPVADYKGGTVAIARRIQQRKSANFASVKTKDIFGQRTFPYKNNNVVYETITIPMPVYIDVAYKISCRTEYQQQMNQIMQPFITETGGINYFNIEKDGHRFEAFMQSDFALESNVAEIGEDERFYQTAFEVKVLAYLIGAGENQATPRAVIRENAVEVKIGRERIIFDDDITHSESQNKKPGDGGKYRG
jgi:hypothetical protein